MPGMRRHWFSSRVLGHLIASTLAAIVLTVSRSAAQDGDIPAPTSLGTVTKKLSGRRPTAHKTMIASAATRFTPSGTRVFVPKLVDALSKDAEEKKSLTELFETALKTLDDEQKKKGVFDLVPALALYVQVLQTIHSGKTVPEVGTDKMAGQLRASLDGPEIAVLSNAEKQSLYEYWVSMGVLNLMLAQAAEAKGKVTLAGLQAAAGAGLKELFGAEPEKIAITAKGLEITGPATTVAAATPPAGPKPSYAAPPQSRLEMMGGSIILWQPKYDGYTKNENEQYYYAIFPTIPTAGKPDREAVFEETWKSVTDNVKVTWKNRTLIHRFYLPSGAVCYVAMGNERHNETLGGYGSCDGTRMTLCLLDFGNYYVPVAQVYSWQNGTDNLGYLQGAFDALVASIRLPGATKPLPYATREQVVGAWTHTNNSYSSTDYVYSSSGAYAGNVTNVSASRMTLILNANGTLKHEFGWYFNGKIQTDIWSGTWTYDRGKIIIRNPKTGKTETYTLMYKGKHPKTNERFLVLHRVFSQNLLTPINSHSSDSQLFVPFKR